MLMVQRLLKLLTVKSHQVSKKKSLYFFFPMLLILPLHLMAVDGDLDISFGNNGVVTTDFEDRDNYGKDVVIQSDGKIVVVGYSSGSTKADISLVRYNSDGSLDGTFGNSGKVMTDFSEHGAIIERAVLQDDGKIVVVGRASNGSRTGIALARYNADGSLDTSFDSDGKITVFIGDDDAYGYDISIDENGKIVVVGRVYGNSQLNCALARFNSDGMFDTSFASIGWTATNFSTGNTCYAMRIQDDGKIVAVGSSNDFFLTRYNIDGTIDTSFGTNGIVTTDIAGNSDSARSIIIQSDGKIVVAGSSVNSDGFTTSMVLARYHINGILDNSFGTNGVMTTFVEHPVNYATDIVLQNNNKIIISGYFWTDPIDGYDDAFIVARYNSNGSPDSTFGTNGIVVTNFGIAEDHAYALALQYNGDIVVAGDTATNLHLFPAYGINFDFAIVRYKNSNSHDPLSVPLLGRFGSMLLMALFSFVAMRRLQKN